MQARGIHGENARLGKSMLEQRDKIGLVFD
jgi:hypothetical protein